MNNKIKIVVVSMCIIAILMIIIFNVKKGKKIENNIVDNKVKEITHSKDENTGEYIIYRNGEEAARVMDEAEIKIYEDNPDYDPKL